MKNFKSHFQFNKLERNGIFFLLVLIILFQGLYFYVKSQPASETDSKVLVDEVGQKRIDSLKILAHKEDIFKTYPFNPNFITDYKGYTLGMSPTEIDRLHAFRKLDKYVNSEQQFQEVTLVSDSLLKVISPYFKFPDWVEKSKVQKGNLLKVKNAELNTFTSNGSLENLKDINSVTEQELKSIIGIGDKLSTRIIKFRDRLGGFLVNEQLYDVYGLKQEVADRVLKLYQVLNPPQIKKININTATVSEIAQNVYISYKVANGIEELRELNGSINSFDELLRIDGFPEEKLDRIVLYLSL